MSQPCLGFMLREPSANSWQLKLEKLWPSCQQHIQHRFGTECVLRSLGRVLPDSSPELRRLPVHGSAQIRKPHPSTSESVEVLLLRLSVCMDFAIQTHLSDDGVDHHSLEQHLQGKSEIEGGEEAINPDTRRNHFPHKCLHSFAKHAIKTSSFVLLPRCCTISPLLKIWSTRPRPRNLSGRGP